MHDVQIRNASIYSDDRFFAGDILIDGGKITAIIEGLRDIEADEVIDATGYIVIPGLIDIHTHGSAGIDVNSASADELDKVSEFNAGNGCTSWIASVLSDTEEKIAECLRNIRITMMSTGSGARLLGAHLEGPFLNKDFKGAMPEHLLRKGNTEMLKRLLEGFGDIVRYITVAPEVDGVMELVSYASSKSIVVAAGHSGASYDEAVESIRRGVTACTHTFNGMKLFHQHEPSLMGAVLESDDVYCEFICDYLHLHPGSVRFLIKVKGTSRAVAVTDSISAAGLPDGEYMLGVNEVVVTNGDARLKHGNSRAGSTLKMNISLKNTVDITGLPLEKVIRMYTRNQAEMFGIYDCYGSIDEGKFADIVIMNNDYQVLRTIVGGKTVYNRM